MARNKLSPEQQAAKKAAQEARDAKRLAAVEAKTKARKEAEEKGLPWNDAIAAARFLEDYDAAFMSAVAGTPKVDTEQTETKPTPSAAELVKMAKAAVGRTTEETPVVTGETANDNSEEIEPLSTTGVSVTTEENPVSDTPAEEAPEETADNSYDPKDPSTWLVDTNGGLVRLPSESNKKYGNRKHTYKLWKKTQAAVQTPSEINKALPLEDTTGRNDELPTTEVKPLPEGTRMLSDEETTWFVQQKITVPEHVPVEWTIEAHEKHIEMVEAMKADAKSAKDSANVIETAIMEGTNEPATTTEAEEPVGDAADETADPQADDAGSTEDAESTDTPAANPNEELPQQATPPVAEATKPTLTLASSQTEDAALAGRAQKFYGDTWTAERAEKLTKAFKFLEMAIRLQQKGDSESRVNMPMTSAIRLETEALGIAVVVAKAA